MYAIRDRNIIRYYKDKEHTVLHREDGPAFIHENGREEYWIDGRLHREDGPAIEYYNGEKHGEKHWYLNGVRHRKDGPAIIYSNGSKEYFLNGKYHREDGPAIEYLNGFKDWYLYGVNYGNIKSLREFKDIVKTLVLI